MKKYLIIVISVILFVLCIDTAYYRLGIYVNFRNNEPVSAATAIKDGVIKKLCRDGEYHIFNVKGVNMSSGIPGTWDKEFAADKETYMRWFALIQEMGANTIRIYTVLSDDFYKAFYEYNNGREDPLYLIQGVWVDDDLLNTSDAFNKHIFHDSFYTYCETAIDAIHGNKKIFEDQFNGIGSGSYTKDVSQWVLGYILGVDWDANSIAYANDIFSDIGGYEGTYLYSDNDASPFEIILAEVGDKMLAYETKRYREQRVFAFSNYASTDPFTYSKRLTEAFLKCASFDPENIKTTENVISGQFASYHVYPYSSEYFNQFTDEEWMSLDIGEKSLYLESNGKLNTYKAYLVHLNNYHEMPVIISGFGASSSRGTAQTEINTGRDQGGMTEKEQGAAIIKCYQDIIDAGSVGACVFNWQDEWYRASWNTSDFSNPNKTALWSNPQAADQAFGLLSFEPGAIKSVCYIDGNLSEWTEKDIVAYGNDGAYISVKYDEKYIYFMVRKEGTDISQTHIYIPIDTTQKSGSNYCANYGAKFDRAADFLLVLNGKDNSRLIVQERYEALCAQYSSEVYGFNAYTSKNIPAKDSPVFKKIYLLLHKKASGNVGEDKYELLETGRLVHGNANPESPNFNSLADFMYSGDAVEVRIPWQMLNFFDPSLMEIHDDYYENYGVVGGYYLDNMYVGLGSEETLSTRIALGKVRLKSWGNEPTYHERLKQSYYILKELWSTN